MNIGEHGGRFASHLTVTNNNLTDIKCIPKKLRGTPSEISGNLMLQC
jgi:hypothetical protein